MALQTQGFKQTTKKLEFYKSDMSPTPKTTLPNTINLLKLPQKSPQKTVSEFKYEALNTETKVYERSERRSIANLLGRKTQFHGSVER